ncbi:MAG TPA: C2 family cysteine protease [Tepidisphaeraceae bacterium]|jgi:Ca2+-binding RTX toxin-like protein
MLSAAYDPVTHALTVNGGVGNDAINLNYSGGWLSVVENGVTTFGNWLANVGTITVYGNDGNDTINYSTGITRANLYGGSGDDYLYGSSDADYLQGNDGNDHLYGYAGNDVLDGWNGDDYVNGGDGDDVLYGYTGSDVLDGWNGNDRLYGEDGNDVLYGYYGNDNLYGGDGNDNMYGEADNDLLDGGTGADAMWGGSGVDTADYSSRTNAVVVCLDGFANDGEFLEGDNANTDIENVNGGYGNDVIYGSSANNYLQGGGGTDYLYGYAGDDVLDGGVGGVAVYSQNTGDDKLYGGLGNDLLHASDYGNNVLHGEAGNDTCYGYGGMDAVYGDDGDDLVCGGDNNDRVYGGAGNDYMYGGNGDDVLVSIDNATGDVLYGEGGYDSFWIDENSYIVFTTADNVADASLWESLTSVHKVQSFANGADRTLDGDNIADPSDSGTRSNFSTRPLFATDGPSKDDVFQGGVGDCYFLATLSATAKTDPNRIRQSVVDLGDGSYAVQMVRSGVTQYVRVDGDLPVDAWGNLVFAKLGHQNSSWVAIMEKAWAFARTGANTYASTSAGWMSEAFNALGSTSTDLWSSPDGTSLLNYIGGELDAGKAVTFSTIMTPPAGCPCVGNHAYMVERVNYQWITILGISIRVPVSVVLRNPWGTDGAGNDGSNDGYVTVTASQALSVFTSVQSAYV